jgi:hypothetical protein
MSRHFLFRGGVIAAAALVFAGTAVAVAPWPGLARSVSTSRAEIRYAAVRVHGATSVRATRVASGELIASRSVKGLYGIPAVTITGTGGGLSPDGTRLVLVEPPTYSALRAHSRFVLVETAHLDVLRTIVLKGEFGFDALSADGRTLYLLQHTDRNNFVHYRVRAYDLRAGRLLPRVIVDKREPDEAMVGFAIARATTAVGRWVYTLYTRTAGEPFVHALDTNGRAAFCIDVPWPGSTAGVWTASLALSDDEKQMTVRSSTGQIIATIDTAKLEVR